MKNKINIHFDQKILQIPSLSSKIKLCSEMVLDTHLI